MVTVKNSKYRFDAWGPAATTKAGRVAAGETTEIPACWFSGFAVGAAVMARALDMVCGFWVPVRYLDGAGRVKGSKTGRLD